MIKFIISLADKIIYKTKNGDFMKRILAFLLVLNFLLLSACSPKQQSVDKTADTTETVTSTDAISNSEITKSETENHSSEPESDKNDNNTEKFDSSDNSNVDNSKPQKETQTTSVSEKTDKDTSFKSKETTTKSSVESTSQQPLIKYATKADEKAIAEKMIYYINQYRKEEGHVTAKKLSGLTTYSEYRSRQLVTNFSHDTDDQRAAATALKYGEYVDPSLYGINGNPYYASCAREAIVKLGPNAMNLTVDEVAKRMADALRSSTGHWNYVGAVQKASSYYNSEYIYIACGVTYSGTTWYGCVNVSDIDTDELTRLGLDSNTFREQIYGK